MSKIRLFTVVYDEHGNFLLGLKNRHSYFQGSSISYFDGERVESEEDNRPVEILSFIDDQISLAEGKKEENPSQALKTVQFCYEVLANRLVRFEVKPRSEIDIRLNLELNTIARDLRKIATELLAFNREDVPDSKILIKVDECIEELKRTRAKLEDSLKKLSNSEQEYNKEQHIFEAGKITFPSVPLEKPWSCYFERRVVPTCSGKQEYPIRDIVVSRDCHNNEKICIDLPKFDDRVAEEKTFWIIKDACAMKALMSDAVNAFKDEFGGYDIFHQIVDSIDAHPYESHICSIDADPNLYMSFQESEVLPTDVIPVPLYIKLGKDSFKELHHQVKTALGLGAQYANEIQQGLFTCEEVNDNRIAKVNDFNRLVERQNFWNWDIRNFQRNERCLSADMIGYYTPQIIKHLEELELAIQHARREKNDHHQHLVALKEQIDLLVKSNKTSVKELMKHYSSEKLTTFSEEGHDLGTDKANYALYQIINEFNYLLVSMDTGKNSVDTQISKILGIPRIDGHCQTLKQSAVSDHPREIEGLSDCTSTYVTPFSGVLNCFEDDCTTRWRYCYSTPKIKKNIMPQVNKLFKLLMLESEDDTLETDIKDLRRRVLDQRSWQSFILDMRHDKTPMDTGKKHDEEPESKDEGGTTPSPSKPKKKSAKKLKTMSKHYY